MTNEEALKILPDMKGAGEDWDKAIDLAIEALKQQGSSQQTAVGSQGLANDTVSRQGAIDAIEKAKTAKAPDGEMYVAKINAEMNIQLLPSVQPVDKDINVSCKDAISRQAAIDIIDYLLRHNDDAKRKGHSQVFINGMEDGYFRARSDILSLPSVQPEIVPCGDCKHWICHDRRCGYWNHGVKPLEWCCHAERKENR